MVSLLNGDGGIVTYGVRRNGVIYGDRINRKEQDVLTHASIDAAIKYIIPYVDGDLYSIHFTDVVERGSCEKLKVVRIKVASAPYDLYEDKNHEVGTTPST